MNNEQRVTIEIKARTVRRLFKWTIAILALIALFFILPTLKSVFTIIVIALFLAFLLDPLVTFLENNGIERLWAVILVFLVIFLVGGVLFKFFAPVIVSEIQGLSKGAQSQSPEEIMRLIQTKLGDKFPILNNPSLQKELTGIIEKFVKKSFSAVFGMISATVSVVMVAFITFFFLKDSRNMKKALISWVPNRYFEMSLNILHKTSTQLGRYIRGQLLVAGIVGALSITALYILHIRYAFFIGTIAGLANMIPYFGPIVGAVPAIIIALIDTGSLGVVITVAVAFACIQLFENVFVSPFIVSKSVSLHPLTIIIVILIGGQLWGILGMLLAVPTASIIKVTVQELYWGFKNYRIL
ncbi:MAG: AI-2E family transporter [Calditrichaeota bacterium]|nr:MAG: AI-2E family transporter [Calditrichota bacterium]